MKNKHLQGSARMALRPRDRAWVIMDDERVVCELRPHPDDDMHRRREYETALQIMEALNT